MAQEVNQIPLDNTPIDVNDQIMTVDETDSVRLRPSSSLLSYINSNITNLQRMFGVLDGNIAVWAEGDDISLIPLTKIADIPSSKIINFQTEVNTLIGNTAVTTTGNQAVGGVKNFTDLRVGGASVVNTSDNATISGDITFNGLVTVDLPTTQPTTPNTLYSNLGVVNITPSSTAPVFLQAIYQFVVIEGDNSDIGTVSATSMLSLPALRYSIISGNDDNEFSIDPISGVLSSLTPNEFSNTSYALSIRVTDSEGQISTTSVTVFIVAINDNAPMFDRSSYIAVVPRQTPTGSIIVEFTLSDADGNSSGTFVLSSSLSNNNLEIQPLAPGSFISSSNGLTYISLPTGNYTISTNGSLSPGSYSGTMTYSTDQTGITATASAVVTITVV